MTGQRDRERRQIALLGAGVLLALAVGGIGWRMTRSLTRPLHDLHRGATELAHTTLPIIVDRLLPGSTEEWAVADVVGRAAGVLPVHGADEVGTVAVAFNEVAKYGPAGTNRWHLPGPYAVHRRESREVRTFDPGRAIPPLRTWPGELIGRELAVRVIAAVAGRAAWATHDGFEVRADQRVQAAARDCARALVGAVLTHHDVPVADCRVRLSAAAHPGGLLTQANLRVCGAPARVQVAGTDAAAAIAAAAARLDCQIRRLGGRRRPWPPPGPDPARAALAQPGRGPITRVKTYRLQVGRACQAAAVLDAMDYDVHLFTDAETGQDAVIYRCGPTGLRLARQHSMHPPSSVPAGLHLTVNPRKTPTLTQPQAADRLAAGWLPFLFFTARDSGRGNLCYRRYDGTIGLIRPAVDPHPTDPPAVVARAVPGNLRGAT